MSIGRCFSQRNSALHHNERAGRKAGGQPTTINTRLDTNRADNETEIIKEPPKLTEADRSAIREALLELANGNPDVALWNAV